MDHILGGSSRDLFQWINWPMEGPLEGPLELFPFRKHGHSWLK